MRRRPPDDRGLFRLVLVLVTGALFCACGSPEVAPRPQPLASATADREDTPPQIVSARLEPEEPKPGGSVRVVVDVSDADGDPVKMTYDWSLDGQPVGAGMPKLALHDASRGDRLAVTVVASDGRADSDPAVLHAVLANRPPVVTRLSIGPALEITAGTEVRVKPEGNDADGDPLRFHYAWTVNDRPVAGDAKSFDTRALTKGDVLVANVRADDGTDLSDAFASPPIRVVNRPPRVVSQPGPSTPGEAFHYVVRAEDPDGDAPLHFELEEAPRGMKIDASTGEILWTPGPDQAGTHPVKVVVDDNNGGRVAHAFDVQVGRGFAPPAAAGD